MLGHSAFDPRKRHAGWRWNRRGDRRDHWRCGGRTGRWRSNRCRPWRRDRLRSRQPYAELRKRERANVVAGSAATASTGTAAAADSATPVAIGDGVARISASEFRILGRGFIMLKFDRI